MDPSSLPRTLPHGLRGRQLGGVGLREAFLTDSLWRLALATSTEVAYPARSGACNWLELDPQEQRYLLAAGGDGSVSAFDVGGAGDDNVPRPSPSSTSTTRVVPPLFVSGGASAAGAPGDRGHRFSATCVCWYPVDSGAFVSGGADGEVKVWDANAALPVASFSLSSNPSSRGPADAGASRPRVMTVAMSSAAGSPSSPSHALIAVGAAAGGGAGAISSAPAVSSSSSTAFAPLRLADARAGAFTHALGSGGGCGGSSSGEGPSTAAVWCVSWSLKDPNQLVSGSADGTARAWDVRRSDACVATLSYEDTRDSRRDEAGRRRRREEGREASPQLRNPPSSYRRAHDAAVTGLVPTPDGLSWVTSGADSAVRVWSTSDFALDERAPSPSSAASSAAGATFNRARRPRQLAASLAPAALFHPSGSAVQVLPLPDGCDRGGFWVDAEGSDNPQQRKHRGNLERPKRKGERGLLLRGHVDAVHACCWSEDRRELYTGGDDKTVLVWSATAASAEEVEEEEGDDDDDDDGLDFGGGRARGPRAGAAGGGGGDEDAWSD